MGVLTITTDGIQLHRAERALPGQSTQRLSLLHAFLRRECVFHVQDLAATHPKNDKRCVARNFNLNSRPTNPTSTPLRDWRRMSNFAASYMNRAESVGRSGQLHHHTYPPNYRLLRGPPLWRQ